MMWLGLELGLQPQDGCSPPLPVSHPELDPLRQPVRIPFASWRQPGVLEGWTVGGDVRSSREDGDGDQKHRPRAQALKKTPSVHLEAGRVEVGHVGDEIEGVGFVRRVLLLPPVQGLSSLRIQRWGDSPHLGAGRVEAREVIPEKVGGARVGGRGRRALK